MKENKKEWILRAFREMDIFLLDVLLDDNRTYQGAKKEIFLEKIKEAFLNFKESDDTELVPYKGFCNSEECKNKVCTGYSFVGNQTKNHMDLIFEELDNEIVNICHCDDFQTEDTSVEKGNLEVISIKPDERVDFNPSIRLMHHLQKYQLASEELLQYKNKVIGVEVYSKWLQKHKYLMGYLSYSECYFYRAYEVFCNWVWVLEPVYEAYNSCHKLATSGLTEFNSLSKNDEMGLLRWLVKYEKLEREAFNFFSSVLNSYNDKIFKAGGFRIDVSEFEEIIQMNAIYNKHYRAALEKYDTHINDDGDDVYQNDIQVNHIINSKEKYQNYLKEYDRYLRKHKKKPNGDSKIDSEKEFIEYLNSFESSNDFFRKYLKCFFPEEFDVYLNKKFKIRSDSASLTFQLEKRGIILTEKNPIHYTIII